MTGIKENELQRALRVLQSVEDRFEAKLLIDGVQDTDYVLKIRSVIDRGLSENEDEQRVWQACDVVEELLIELHNLTELEAVCARYLHRLSSSRYLDQPENVVKALKDKFELVMSQVEESKSQLNPSVQVDHLSDLRKTLRGCVRSVHEYTQIKVGRRILKDSVVSVAVLLASIVLAGFVVASNHVLAAIPYSFEELFFGRGTRIAVTGIASAILGQGNLILTEKPLISTETLRLSEVQLNMVVGGIAALGTIYMVKAEIILAGLAKNISTESYSEPIALALGFVGGLTPIAIARIATSVNR